MKKWIWIIAVIVIAVGAFLVFDGKIISQGAQVGFENVETVEVAIDTLTASIGATGKVRANRSATLTWDISGEVDQVNVQVGDIVSDGQILASL